MSKPLIVLRGYHWCQEEIEKTPLGGIFYLGLNMSATCQFRCPYCFVGHRNLYSGKDDLNLDQKLGLLTQAAECGVRVVSMPGRGEPLSDPDFWPIVEVAERLGLYVVVYTNGFPLDGEKIKRLTDLPISLFLKLDSLEPKIYEEMVGMKDVFSRVWKNINFLLESFSCPVVEEGRLVSRLGFNSVVSRQTAKSIPQVADWCAEQGVYFTCRSPVKVGEASINWSSLVGQEEAALFSLGRQYAARDFTSATPQGQCGIYRFGLTIDNDGEVLVCPDARREAGFRQIGNIKDSSLEELIRRRSILFPLNSDSGFCFAKSQRNE